jgi:hypothetical protein
MKRVAALLVLALHTWAAEPIAGKWLLKSQQVGGRETASTPLTLRITQTGDALEFEYSAAASRMRFAARLDGSAADVKNADGRKIGTAKVTRGGGPSQYFVMLEGPNRPTSNGKLTVSSNGKTLVSESDAIARDGAKLHTVQTFERQ